MDASVGEMLVEGLKLMAVGMSIVFSFLLLLVGVLFGMSKMASRLVPESLVPAAEAAGMGASGTSGTEDSRIAAIAAAVGYYRRRHRG